MMVKMNRLMLIDGNALVHRAFHAFPSTLTHNGQPVNAVYGFTKMLLSALSELKPSHAAVCFDVSKDTFRHKAYAEYKAKRSATPQALYDQLFMVKEAVAAFGFPSLGVEGYEADDVIATLTKRAAKDGLEVAIVTGDKDTFQLVGPHVRVYTPQNGKSGLKTIDEAAVQERLGVPPKLVGAWKALAGDPSDNIPGIPGIGDKTASTLLQTFGSLEGVLKAAESADERMPEGVAKKIIAGDHKALDALKLVELVSDVPLRFNLAEAQSDDVLTRPQLHNFLEELGFVSILKLLPAPRSTSQKALF